MPIIVKDVTHIYMPGTPFETKALDNINLTVEDGEFLGIIGHTGSGKSTLVQHLNGLLQPTSGKIYVDDIDLTGKKVNLRAVRQKVGIVFQYPEHQLFEETVALDVAFGPKNLGLSDEETEQRVREALAMVNLSYDEVKDRSPFELSGGQRRRVAIAGVLAMKPKILILDEPTAGLDPRGREEIFAQVVAIRRRMGITVVLVSHSMEDVARLADRLVVMHKGKLILTGTPREVFRHGDTLKQVGLGVPQITEVVRALNARGFGLPEDIITVEEAKKAILKKLGGSRRA